MMARNGAASTITSTFKIQVRYDLELRTAPQAPNCIGGSGGQSPPMGGSGGEAPRRFFFGVSDQKNRKFELKWAFS